MRQLWMALLLCGCGSRHVRPADQNPSPQTQQVSFVQTQGAHFELGGRPFYFQGTNFYRLGIIEKQPDDLVPAILRQFADHDIKVLRLWAFSCGTAHPMIRAIVDGTVQYDEEALRRLDLVVASARDADVKLIMPLVNYETEYCSMGWWAQQVTGQTDRQLFYRDAQIKQLFHRHIATLLDRVNTVNRTRYRDEPAIMAIELANEPHTEDRYEVAHGLAPGSLLRGWLDETSRLIRQLDPNHLIATGEEGYKVAPSDRDEGSRHAWLSDGTKGADYVGNLSLPNVDFATVHAYPDHWQIPVADFDWFDQHYIGDRADRAHEVGKPIVLEETGFSHEIPAGYPDAAVMLAWLYRAANRSDYAGTMVWQLVPPGTEDGDFIYDFTSPLAKVVFDQAAAMGERRFTGP